MDLGGVDVAGARGEPKEGDPLYGLYQHKRSFGGRWVELTGAHERVYDARGYQAGRLAGPGRSGGPPMTARVRGRPPGRRRHSRARPLGGLIDRLDGRGPPARRPERRPGDRRGRARRDPHPRRHPRFARRPRRLAVRGGPRAPRRRPRVRRAAAAAKGAAAALVDHALPDVALPQLVVAGTREALATAAAWWYGDPSHDLAVVGITGTDGKTTTSFLAVAALEAAGLRTGHDRHGGDADRRRPDRERGARHDARGARAPARPPRDGARGDTAAVIETTSHGLALARVDEIAYDVAILTNLTHEHLDLHGTWEAYRDAKLRLFEKLARSGT